MVTSGDLAYNTTFSDKLYTVTACRPHIQSPLVVYILQRSNIFCAKKKRGHSSGLEMQNE